jgi:hypothetical protein
MKHSIILVIGGLALFVATVTTVANMTDTERDEMYAMVKSNHLGRTSLAFRATVGPQMLAEANYFSKSLNLPPLRPIQENDVFKFYVAAPFFSRIDNTNLSSPVARLRAATYVPGGFIETTNFAFSFHLGRLSGIFNKINHDERFDLYPEWAKTPSLIDTKGAYQLATQWLTAVDIDVSALEKKYPPKVEQQWCWNQPGLNVYHPPGDTNKTMLPIFNVTWGTNWVEYPAQIQILGTTKELMKLNYSDFLASRRPQLVITNAIELNNIPDPSLKQLQKPQPSQTNPAASSSRQI